MRRDLFPDFLFVGHLGSLEAFPLIQHVCGIRVNYFIFGLDDPIGFSFNCDPIFVDFLGFSVESLLGFLKPSLIFLFLGLLLHLVCFGLHNFLLQFGLSLVQIEVVEQGVVLFQFHSHHGGLSTLALHVLEHFVVGGDLLLVNSEHLPDSIDGSVGHELLKLGV